MSPAARFVFREPVCRVGEMMFQTSIELAVERSGTGIAQVIRSITCLVRAGAVP